MNGQEKEYVDVTKRTREQADLQDELFGYEDFKEGEDMIGWMVTYSQVLWPDNFVVDTQLTTEPCFSF